jgi:hypothetical protein
MPRRYAMPLRLLLSLILDLRRFRCPIFAITLSPPAIFAIAATLIRQLSPLMPFRHAMPAADTPRIIISCFF